MLAADVASAIALGSWETRGKGVLQVTGSGGGVRLPMLSSQGTGHVSIPHCVLNPSHVTSAPAYSTNSVLPAPRCLREVSTGPWLLPARCPTHAPSLGTRVPWL